MVKIKNRQSSKKTEPIDHVNLNILKYYQDIKKNGKKSQNINILVLCLF